MRQPSPRWALLFLILQWGAEASRRHPRRTLLRPAECREPDDLKTRLVDWHRDASQMDVEPSIVEQQYVDDNVPTGEEATVCEQMPDTDPNSTVMQRSLCPWSWKSTYDEQRVPKTLTEAFCLCRKSRGNLDAYCMPIRRQVAVLRRGECEPETMTYTYERSVQWITVGCHSVLPRSQRALPLFNHYKRSDNALVAT